MVKVVLSDGKHCDVRRLGMFELDNVKAPKSGMFTYEVKTLSGETYQAEYDIERYRTPPQKPEEPEHEIEEKSPAWYDLREYQLYQAALAYKKDALLDVARYANDVARYILRKCVSADDWHRIITPDDWNAVYSAALVPLVTFDLIVETLQGTFGASWNGQQIFEALKQSAGGQGEYDAVRVWETQLMVEMGLSEVEYLVMDIHERARKICAMKLDNWISSLDTDAATKKMESEREFARKTGKRGRR